jgi:hypothetical protein
VQEADSLPFFKVNPFVLTVNRRYKGASKRAGPSFLRASRNDAEKKDSRDFGDAAVKLPPANSRSLVVQKADSLGMTA